MKKTGSISVLLALLFSISGCGTQVPSTESTDLKNIKIDTEASFTFDYPTDEAHLDMFLENDTFDMVVKGGPFYSGAQVSDQPIMKIYHELRTVKIQEVQTVTEALFTDSVEVKQSLDKHKGYFTDLWSAALEAEPSLLNASREAANILVENEVRFDGLMAQYNSVETTIENPLVKARMEHLKTTLAMKLGVALETDLTNLLAMSAQTIVIFEDSDNEGLQKIATEIDKKMQNIDAVSEQFTSVSQKIRELEVMVKQLNTAEQLMGLASVEFIKDELPAIQEQLNAATPSEQVTAEDLEFMREYTDFYDTLATDLETTLNDINPEYLLDEKVMAMIMEDEASFVLIPTTYAAGRGNFFERAARTLKFKARKVANGVNIAKDCAWAGLKTGYKEGKRTLGSLVDGAATSFKSAVGYVYGRSAGLDHKESMEIVGDNFYESQKRFDNYQSGKQVFEDAEGYFTAAEDTGGALAEEGVKIIFGDGNISWVAGHIGKMSVNMFTGFGKGVTKILNPDSTAGEVAEGYLDVGLSMIGGSKCIFKGSQVFSGGKNTFKNLGKKGLNFLERLAKNADIQNLKNISAEILKNRKLTAGQIKSLISNAKRIEADEILVQQLKKIGTNLNEEFTDLLKEGGKTFVKNIKSGGGSYKEFVEQSFKNSLSGYREALTKVLGESAKDYIDNLVASKADDMFKAIVKDYIDKGVIPGLEPEFPPLADLAGSWSGEMLINDVIMSEEMKSSGGDEGCDLSQLEELKGQTKPMNFQLNPSGENSGTINITATDTDPLNMTFTYNAGTLTGSTTQDEGVITLSLTFSESGTTGPLNVDYQSAIKIFTTINAQKN